MPPLSSAVRIFPKFFDSTARGFPYSRLLGPSNRFLPMATRYFGAPIKRNEDGRLLTGQALFVDDVELPGLLHAAFLRSPIAHARILRLDASAARRHKNITAIYTATDLGA